LAEFSALGPASAGTNRRLVQRQCKPKLIPLYSSLFGCARCGTCVACAPLFAEALARLLLLLAGFVVATLHGEVSLLLLLFGPMAE
jgi:hypothetical protein